MVSPALGSSRHCAPDDENGNVTPLREVCGREVFATAIVDRFFFHAIPANSALGAGEQPLVGASTKLNQKPESRFSTTAPRRQQWLAALECLAILMEYDFEGGQAKGRLE